MKILPRWKNRWHEAMKERGTYFKAASIVLITLVVCSCASLRRTKTVKKTPSTKGIRPYCVEERCYFPLPSAKGYVEEGYASWYGPRFHGRRTSSGEPFNMHALTAAHRTLPFGTYVRVTRLDNGKSVIVRINDRGPFVRNRIIDLSREAAKRLGMLRDGTVKVRVEALQPATLSPYASNENQWILQPVPSFTKGLFEIQVASFANKNNAIRLKNRLAKQFDYAVIVPFRCEKVTFYRVRVGIFKDISKARKALEKIQREGFHDAFVIAREGDS